MGFGKEPLAELQALITSGATWHATTLLYARRDTRSRLLHKRRARSASCLGFLGVFCLTQPSSLEALWRGWHADMRCFLVPWLTGHGRRAACRAWGDKSFITATRRARSPPNHAVSPQCAIRTRQMDGHGPRTLQTLLVARSCLAGCGKACVIRAISFAVCRMFRPASCLPSRRSRLLIA